MYYEAPDYIEDPIVKCYCVKVIEVWVDGDKRQCDTLGPFASPVACLAAFHAEYGEGQPGEYHYEGETYPDECRESELKS